MFNVRRFTDAFVDFSQVSEEDWFAYARDPEVGPNAGWPPHQSRDVSVPILLKFITEKKTFAIEYEGRAVGSIGVERYDEELFPDLAPLRCRELGFVLSRECWGKGLMTEAVREVIRYLFEEQGLDAIVCSHYVWNDRSRRVQEKCGFRPYALCTRRTVMDTEEPSQLRVLTREAYFAACRGEVPRGEQA